MPFTPRAESLSIILKRTLSLYRGHLFLFLGISAIPNLFLLMVQLGLERVDVRSAHPEMFDWLAGLSVSFASLFASSIATAATTVAVANIYTDRLPDLWDSFARLSGKAFKIVFAAFLVQLVVGVGAVLCIIPGIYWAGIYGVTIPAAVLENLGGTKAMDRSHSLTKNSVGRIVIVFFLTSIVIGILGFALKTTATALGFTSPAYHGILSKEVLRLVITAIGGILFGPISAIALVLEYFDLRVRYECFDMQQLKALMMAPQNISSSTYAGKIE